MEMAWHSSGVRPLAGVDLLGRDQAIDNLGCALQERPELGGLCGGQLADPRHVPARLDEQGADAEWAYAVLDEPGG